MVKKKQQRDVGGKVMDKIRNQKITMRSKLYFKFLTVLLVISSALFIVLSAIMGTIAYRQVILGRGLNLGEFGRRGNAEFIATLPWMAITVALLTLVIAYVLVKHFDFTYRHKIYVVVAALLLAVISLATIFMNTNIGDKAGGLAPFRPFHTFSRFSEEHQLSGTIIEKDDDHIVLLSKDKKITIHLEDTLKGPKFDYEVGDEVTVFGDWESEDSFDAYGLRPGNMDMMPRHRVNGMRLENGFMK